MRGDRGNHVTDPSQQTATPDPETGGDDQPEDAAQKIPVVELPEAGDHRAQHGRKTWVLHRPIVTVTRYSPLLSGKWSSFTPRDSSPAVPARNEPVAPMKRATVSPI